MAQDEIETLDRVTQVLIERSTQMGVTGFSVRGEALTLLDSLDQEGPLTWALFMHSNILSSMAGIKSMPFECVTDTDALFGNRAGVKAGASLPLSFAAPFLDAALEHAVVVALKDLNCTHEDWKAMDDDMRIIPVEVYFQDLRENWVDERFEFGSAAEKVLNWPVLLDFETYEEQMGLGQGQSQSDKLRISGITSLTPKQ